MSELDDLDLEQISAGKELLPLLPLILPFFYPKSVVEEARVKRAAARSQ